MVKTIESLTEEQTNAMPGWVDKWVEWGTDCSPTPKQTVEDGIRACYRLSDQREPEEILWVRSPFEGVEVHTDRIGPSWRNYIIGQWISGVLATWTFFRDVCDLEFPDDTNERINAYIAANSAGWWWPYENLCIVSERPLYVHMEDQNLHAENGPAIEWSDGNKMYMWRGTRIPDWVVEDLTLERISHERNTEIRRCAIERYGWENWLLDAKVTPVHEEEDVGNPGAVLRLYDLPSEAQVYDENVRLLVMTNASRDPDGTLRTFAETVPSEIETAVSAAAWQFGTTEDLYRKIGRAT